jgi:hypothetical protein
MVICPASKQPGRSLAIAGLPNATSRLLLCALGPTCRSMVRHGHNRALARQTIIGQHPSFRCPLEEGSGKGDQLLSVKQPSTWHQSNSDISRRGWGSPPRRANPQPAQNPGDHLVDYGMSMTTTVNREGAREQGSQAIQNSGHILAFESWGGRWRTRRQHSLGYRPTELDGVSW